MHREAAWHVISGSFQKQPVQAASFTSSIIENPKPEATAKPTLMTGNPLRLLIPSLEIELPIINGVYNEQAKSWTLSSDKVQYASITPSPNNRGGNTYLYAHNSNALLGSLHNIKTKEFAYIITDNGLTFSYLYEGSVEVSPQNTDLLKYKGAPILTIQTCSGSFYQNRQLFSFSLSSVN